MAWNESIDSLSHTFTHKATKWICYLTTSTAPGRTLGSLPIIETLAANEPSMLKTTHSIPLGNTVRKASALVWSPLRGKRDMKCEENQDPTLDQTRDQFNNEELFSFSPQGESFTSANWTLLGILANYLRWDNLEIQHFWIHYNLQSPIDLLDNHFNGVDSHGQLFWFWEWCRSLCHCCWSPRCLSAPSDQTVAGSSRTHRPERQNNKEKDSEKERMRGREIIEGY